MPQGQLKGRKGEEKSPFFLAIGVS